MPWYISAVMDRQSFAERDSISVLVQAASLFCEGLKIHCVSFCRHNTTAIEILNWLRQLAADPLFKFVGKVLPKFLLTASWFQTSDLLNCVGLSHPLLWGAVVYGIGCAAFKDRV